MLWHVWLQLNLHHQVKQRAHCATVAWNIPIKVLAPYINHRVCCDSGTRGRGKDELTQAYKSYADYAFPDKETRQPYCENAADSVLCTPTNDECKFPNWKCVLRKCTVFRAIALPEVEMDTSIRAPMIMFNTYITQFTCSHHGILIREKITTYLDAKGKSKQTYLLCEKLIKIKTPDFTRGKLHERVKLFSIQRKIGYFRSEFYIKLIEK